MLRTDNNNSGGVAVLTVISNNSNSNTTNTTVSTNNSPSLLEVIVPWLMVVFIFIVLCAALIFAINYLRAVVAERNRAASEHRDPDGKLVALSFGPRREYKYLVETGELVRLGRNGLSSRVPDPYLLMQARRQAKEAAYEEVSDDGGEYVAHTRQVYYAPSATATTTYANSNAAADSGGEGKGRTRASSAVRGASQQPPALAKRRSPLPSSTNYVATAYPYSPQFINNNSSPARVKASPYAGLSSTTNTTTQAQKLTPAQALQLALSFAKPAQPALPKNLPLPTKAKTSSRAYVLDRSQLGVGAETSLLGLLRAFGSSQLSTLVIPLKPAPATSSPTQAYYYDDGQADGESEEEEYVYPDDDANDDYYDQEADTEDFNLATTTSSTAANPG